jgi:hypothetical protein
MHSCVGGAEVGLGYSTFSISFSSTGQLGKEASPGAEILASLDSGYTLVP